MRGIHGVLYGICTAKHLFLLRVKNRMIRDRDASRGVISPSRIGRKRLSIGHRLASSQEESTVYGL